MPTFRRRKGKVFANLALNHHGDGRIALWLNTPPVLQSERVDESARHFFVPQYVGPAGFDADELHSLALESYRHSASKRMLAALEAGAPPVAAAARPRKSPARRK